MKKWLLLFAVLACFGCQTTNDRHPDSVSNEATVSWIGDCGNGTPIERSCRFQRY